MSVLIEVIIATLFSVVMSTEEVKNKISQHTEAQELVADVSVYEKCDLD